MPPTTSLLDAIIEDNAKPTPEVPPKTRTITTDDGNLLGYR